MPKNRLSYAKQNRLIDHFVCGKLSVPAPMLIVHA